MSKKNRAAKEAAEEEKDETLNAAAEEQQAEEQQDVAEEEPQPDAEQKLAESEAKLAELQERLLRQMAEFDNYRKRTIKEKAELIKTAGADILTKILPIIDDFERAISANRDSDDAAAIKEGFELIYSKMMHALEAEGLKKIDAKEQVFDTDFHEAIAMVPAPTEEMKGKVIDCTREGYMLGDKVIRIAQVVVGN